MAGSGSRSVDPPGGRTDIPAYPLYHVTLRGEKPRPGYAEEPTTWGEHLKTRRLDLGLNQREVAERVGANHKTYENWEQGKYEPEFRFYPSLVAFLGYEPFPEPATFALRIRWKREREGLSQRGLAARLGLDPTTIQAWEWGRVKQVQKRVQRIFEEYVGEK